MTIINILAILMLGAGPTQVAGFGGTTQALINFFSGSRAVVSSHAVQVSASAPVGEHRGLR